MANTKSALKRVRQTKTRTALNQTQKTRVKNARKAALAAIDGGDAAAIEKAVRTLYSVADRAVKNGLLHKNYSKRLKSRFMNRLAVKSA